jgi:hypothetical protein
MAILKIYILGAGLKLTSLKSKVHYLAKGNEDVGLSQASEAVVYF